MSLRNARPSLFVLVLIACGAIAQTFSGASAILEPQSSGIVGEAWRSDGRTKAAKPKDPNAGASDEALVFAAGPIAGSFDIEYGSVRRIAPSPASVPAVLADADSIEPAWSPDGKKVVFISMRDGLDLDWVPKLTNREVYIMNHDGTDQRRLTDNNLAEAQPVFSPDGTKIIFVRSVDVNNITDSAVYSMNLDGSNQTLLFDEACIPPVQGGGKTTKPERIPGFYPGVIGIDSPNYSPDGTKIAFGAFGGTFLYDTGAGTCSLFASGNDPAEPRFSPDGTKLMVSTGSFDPGEGVRIYNLAGTLLNSHFPPGYYSTPVWSPDGTKIAYLGSSNHSFGPDEIRIFDLTSQVTETVFSAAQTELVSGLSWSVPTVTVPPIALSLSPYSVSGGQSVSGTVRMNPATFPAGGGTVNLSISGVPGLLSLPQATVVVPAGSTTAPFTIDTIAYASTLRNYKSADIVAEYAGDTARATVSVRPQRPDLRVVTASAPTPVVLGASTSVSWTIENAGQAATPASFTDRVYFSSDAQLDPGDVLLSSLSNAALGTGQQRVNSRTVTLSHSLNPQSQQNYIIFVTNHNPYAVDEDGRYADNIFALPIQIILPDVTVENLVVPAQIEPGVPFTVTYTVRNSNAPTGTSFQNRIFYSEDQIIGNGDDVVIDLFSQSAMTAGQTAVRTDTGNTVSTLPVRPDGQWLIYVRVDHTNALSEGPTGEANNIGSQTVPFFYRVPDLQVSAVNAPAEVNSQTAFTVDWTDFNAGTRSAGTFTDRVFFSLDNQVGGDTQLLSNSLSGGLAANASANRSFSVTIPTTAVPQTGDYFIYVQTDATSTIDEGANESNNTRFRPIRVVRLSPDIVAENLTAPAEIEPGVNYGFSYTVRNAGAATTAVSFNNRLYFSFDQTVGNADDVLLDSYTQAAMTAGQTVTRNVSNAQIPTLPVAPDGQGLVYARVDFANAVNEGTGGEANNTTQQSAQFYYRVPDLQVTSASSPAEVDSDTPFSLEWTDLNAGNRAAGTFTDKVFFSTDNQVGSDVEIGSFVLTNGLTPSASANRIQNVTIPTASVPQTGNYFVYIRTDANSNIDEGANEGNNVRFQPVRVRRLLRPDLTVSNIVAPNAAFFDQTIQVQWTVTNTGQGPTNAPQWKDKVFLHTSQTGSSSFLVAQTSSISALNAGESYTAQATFKIPRGYNGSYVFTVRTDSDGALNEESTSNNTLTRPIQINVPPLPDLIVESVQVPLPEAFAGQPLLVNYTVKNQGTGDAYFWRDRIYLSRDTTLNTSQDKLIFATDGYDSGPLGANQTRAMSTRNRRPGTFPAQYEPMRLPFDVEGQWYVFVVTDFANEVYEFTNENNNTNYDSVQPGAPLNILVTPPDLVVENAPAAPDSATSGQSLQVGFTVKNQGAFGAGSNLFHAVYLSSDQTLDANDRLLTTVRDENPFAPGAEHPFVLNVFLPNCLPNGNHYLFAVADFDRRQFEFDPNFDAEANNASPPKQVLVTTSPPDLRVSNLQVPAITQPGQTVSLIWTVSNTGSGAANGSWTDRVVLRSTNPQISAQTLLTAERTGGLASGTSYTQTRNVTLPAFMEGEYYLSVTADQYDVVPECGAEDNNSANSTNFTVQNNLPDLVIDAAGAPATAAVGDSISIAWTGRNSNGPMPANSPSWSDYVYLSADPNLGPGDRFLGSSINQSPLPGGQTYQRQIQVSTGNVPAGTYYLLVEADGNGKVYEGASNTAPEQNNVRASAPITLTSPSVDLQVASVTVAPPFYSGTDLSFSWTVTNFGATQTLGASWTDYVILSRDLILDPTDRILGFRTRSSALPGGASYTVTDTFPVPNGLTGDYNVFVVTDYKNKIVEDNNSNNTSAPFALDLVLPPPADLNVTGIAPPATVNLGEFASFSWTVQNSGANAVSGRWRDTIYLSRDTFWDSGDIFVGQSDLSSSTTPVPSGGTYTTSAIARIAGVGEGTYYVIARTDAQNRIRETDEANNVSAATAITTVTVTELPVNTPLNTTLADGEEKYFKITPPPIETLLISLSSDLLRSNELLTNFGSIVSRADYDFQGERPREPNQRNFIPETEDGSYYSLVRNDSIPASFAGQFGTGGKNAANGPGTPQNITVTAQILPFSIQRVTPDVAGNEGFATLVIEGAKFRQGATVKLVGSGNNEISPIDLRVATAKIAAVFDFKGKAIGDYDVVVTNPDAATTTLAAGFKIVAGGGHSLRPNILGPSVLRDTFRGRVRYTFSAVNDGLNDAMFVPIVIELPVGMQYELDLSNYIEYPPGSFPPESDVSQLPFHFDFADRRVLFLMAPILRSKSSVQINVDLLVPFSTGIPMAVSVLPPLAEMLLSSSATSTGSAAKRTTNMVGPFAEEDCWSEFVRSLAFALLGELIGAKFKEAEACLKLIANTATFVVDLVSGVLMGELTGNSLSASGAFSKAFGKMYNLAQNVAECAGLAMPPWFEAIPRIWSALELILTLTDCLDKRKQRLIVARRGSFDPNEKIGPDGYGAERFVPVRQPMLFRINFENLATATAPAQRVRIADELPPTLDLRTVRLKEIGFKQNSFSVPDNQAFYQQRVQLGADLNNLQADLVAGVDLVNRRIFWTLTAIDPATGEPPVDPLLGLLPPNNGNRDGEGYVTFTVEPTPTMPTRSEIRNFATIIFDDNEPIVTNATSNLIDSGIPVSSVSPLPLTSESPEFALNLTGGDDPDGSGFKGIDVYYSKDDMPYIPYITSTTAPAALFRGEWGKSYRFYSIARDNAGNIELPPVTPDATIRVLGGDTEGDVGPRPNGNDGQVSVADVAQVRRFAAGLDSDFLYNEFQRADTAPLPTGGNGALSTADVIQARRFAAGLDPSAAAAGPNEAVPFTGTTVAGNALLPREIRPVFVSRTGNRVRIGIELEAQGDEAGVGFTLNFNPAVLSNPGNAAVGTGAAGSTLTVNDSQAALGRLGMIVDNDPNSPFPAGTRQIATVEFDVASGNPASADFTFGSSPVVSEAVGGTAGALTAVFPARTVSLLVPTSASVSISGRVTANGGGVPRARIALTGADGETRTVLTGSLGHFRFDGVVPGRTYVLTVSSKRAAFSPRAVTAVDDVTIVNFEEDP